VFHLLALTVVLGAPVPRDGRPLRNADPPKEWKPADLAAAVPRRDDAGPVRVLAWEVIDTKRGFVVERLLAVIELKEPTDDGERFVLTYLYRHPKAEKPEWRCTEIGGTRFRPNGVPEIHFTYGNTFCRKPPTDADIDGLLTRLHWAATLAGEMDKTPELTAGGVVYANWKAALGREPPAKLFPELKATAK